MRPSLTTVWFALCLLGTALLAACSDDDSAPSSPSPAGAGGLAGAGSAGASGAGAAAGATNTAGGSAGTAGSAGQAQVGGQSGQGNGGNGGQAGGSSSPLDCAYLTGEANCWNVFAAEIAKACGHDDSMIGVLAASKGTCDYADGTQITFTPALDDKDLFAKDFTVTIKRGGEECAVVSRKEGRSELRRGGKSVVFELRDNSATLTCADGARYDLNETPLLYECPSGGFFTLAPTIQTSTGSLWLNPGDHGMVRCQAP